MDLRHLRYFIAVAEELNFSRAAERLHVSQPPLSRQIRDLEYELGGKLLERDRQSVKLTRVGRAVLILSRKLLRDAEQLKVELLAINQGRPEVLHVGYSPSSSVSIMPGVLSQYAELSAGSSITLHDASYSELLTGLRTKKFHGALTSRPYAKDMRGLKFELVSRHPPGIICTVSHPLAQQTAVFASAVLKTRLVVYGASEFPEYNNWMSKVLGVRRSQLTISQECGDVLSLVAAVENGKGVAVIGEFITAVIGDRLRFVPFHSKTHTVEVGLLYRKGGTTGHVKKLILACGAIKRSSETG